MKTIKPLFASAFLLLTNCTYVSEGVIADQKRYAETTPKDIFGDNTDNPSS
ncbi:MAG: hypothetical protein HOP23_00830 [Methylococcaceae bacterium]|nr:hypothetical protein [Methylococcaceae bacterium]